MNSIKTTIAGVLTILIALASAGLGYVKTGAMPDFGSLIAAITAGIGLITARDNSVTSEQAGAK
jgi:hypothetical protein